jgi:hypothetical protein
MTMQTPDPSRHEEFVALYVRHESAIFSFVLSMVQNTADAEDVVQRASMTMWRCFGQFEPRPEGDQRPGFDSLILAADQRTLLVDLQENPGHLDQVRVLVETE